MCPKSCKQLLTLICIFAELITKDLAKELPFIAKHSNVLFGHFLAACKWHPIKYLVWPDTP